MHCFCRFLLWFGSALVLTFLSASLLQAQQSGNSTTARGGRTDTLRLEQQRQLERQMLERALAEPRAGGGRNPRLVLAEFRTAFLSLQITNNELVKAVSGGGPVDLKFVSKSAAEIRRLGRQLKANLLIPKTEGIAQRATVSPEPGLEQLRAALTTLDNLILDFVSNPVFESAKVVDIPLSAKARGTLAEIISLSGWIKHHSERSLRRGSLR